MVIEYHEKYLKRLANVYLDIYDMHGHEAAAAWHTRTLEGDPELKGRLHGVIKSEAPRRGKVIKE